MLSLFTLLFSGQPRYTYHVQTCHGKSPYSIPRKSYRNNGNVTSSENDVKKPQAAHKSTLFTCSICFKTFSKERSLFQHNTRVHCTQYYPPRVSAVPEDMSLGETSSQMMQVQATDGGCVKEENQEQSSNGTTSQGSERACVVCSMKFHSESDMYNHLLESHIQVLGVERKEAGGVSSVVDVNVETPGSVTTDLSNGLLRTAVSYQCL